MRNCRANDSGMLKRAEHGFCGLLLSFPAVMPRECGASSIRVHATVMGYWIARFRGRSSVSQVSELGGRLSPALGHELVELQLVPRLAQAHEELLEFALLVLQAAQCLGAVVVEGPIATGGA